MTTEAGITDGEPDDVQRCYYCSHVFDGSPAPTVNIPSATLYLCPSCGRWSDGS